RAQTWLQRILKARLVNVAKDFFDKMTASDVPAAINTENRVTSSTRSSQAGMMIVVHREEGVPLCQETHFLYGIITGSAFECIHPGIDLRSQTGAERLQEGQCFPGSHNSNAVANAISIYNSALVKKAFQSDLSGMKCAPQRQLLWIGSGKPIQAA